MASQEALWRRHFALTPNFIGLGALMWLLGVGPGDLLRRLRDRASALGSAGHGARDRDHPAGRGPYQRFFGGSRNRRGDYSGIALDPTDEKQLWVFNELADLT